MSQHTDPAEPALADQEPVVIGDAIKAVLAALAALGWVTIPDATVATIVTAVEAVLFLAAVVWTRRKAFSPATVAHLLGNRAE